MSIDPKLVELLGLDTGALAKRSQSERAWLTRLVHEVIEPFDQILKQHQQEFLQKGLKGLTPELVKETFDFNDSMHQSIALMLALYVVSNFPPNDEMMGVAIELTAHNLVTLAKRMCKQARALSPRKGDRDGRNNLEEE